MDSAIMKYKCKTCDGTYNETCEDGLNYYHACPRVLNDKDEYVERADKRDENANKKLEGKGRVEI